MKFTPEEVREHEERVKVLVEAIHAVFDSITTECHDFSSADLLGAHVNATIDTMRAFRFLGLIDDQGLKTILDRMLLAAVCDTPKDKVN